MGSKQVWFLGVRNWRTAVQDQWSAGCPRRITIHDAARRCIYFEQQPCQISPRSDLERRSLRLFKRSSPTRTIKWVAECDQFLIQQEQQGVAVRRSDRETRVSFLFSSCCPMHTLRRGTCGQCPVVCPLLLLPLLLQCYCCCCCWCIRQFANYKLIIINYDLTGKSDTVRLWRMLSPIYVRSLTTIGCEIKKF